MSAHPPTAGADAALHAAVLDWYAAQGFDMDAADAAVRAAAETGALLPTPASAGDLHGSGSSWG